MDSGHGQKLTRKQELAIAALLREPTQKQACVSVGVSEVTMIRWMRTPSFQVAYEDARKGLVDDAIRMLTAASGSAIKTLKEVAESGEKDSDRVKAALGILAHSLGQKIKVEGDTKTHHTWTIEIEQFRKLPIDERVRMVKG